MQAILPLVADDEVPTAPLGEAIRRCVSDLAEARAIRGLLLITFFSPGGRRLSGAVVLVAWRAGYDAATAGIDVPALQARLAPYTDLPVNPFVQVPTDPGSPWNLPSHLPVLMAWGIEPWHSHVVGVLYSADADCAWARTRGR